MNITYIIGVVGAIVIMLIGMMFGGEGGLLTPTQVANFWDPASVFITIGCTLFIIVARSEERRVGKECRL